MVKDRVTGWAIVSVWLRFRVGIWDTFRLLFRVRVEVISFRIRARMRVRVNAEVIVCFWDAVESLNHAWNRPRTHTFTQSYFLSHSIRFNP